MGQTASESKTKILLAEDESFVGELYAKALLGEGYEVDLAKTGPECLALANTGKYDLILLDLMLPGLTGFDILKTLKSREASGKLKTKIIILTNLELQGQDREKVEQRADGFLLKANTTPRQLIEYLKTYIPHL